MTYVIIIVVAVVLGGAILVLGMGGINQAGVGFDQFFETGQQQLEKLTPSDVRTVCSDWVSSGSKVYDPDTIYNLGIPELFRPYRRFWDRCGGPLNTLVTSCKSSSEECPNGVLDSSARSYSREFGPLRGSEVISCCIHACDVATSIYSRCKHTSNTEAELANCFNLEMEETILRGEGC